MFALLAAFRFCFLIECWAFNLCIQWSRSQIAWMKAEMFGDDQDCQKHRYLTEMTCQWFEGGVTWLLPTRGWIHQGLDSNRWIFQPLDTNGNRPIVYSPMTVIWRLFLELKCIVNCWQLPSRAIRRHLIRLIFTTNCSWSYLDRVSWVESASN